jgi:hypothetical protein
VTVTTVSTLVAGAASINGGAATTVGATTSPLPWSATTDAAGAWVVVAMALASVAVSDAGGAVPPPADAAPYGLHQSAST